MIPEVNDDRIPNEERSQEVPEPRPVTRGQEDRRTGGAKIRLTALNTTKSSLLVGAAYPRLCSVIVEASRTWASE
jgi:hypothetical protein